MEIFKINVHSPLYYYGIDLYLSWQKLMKYKCVIFDCDGVLVDSEKISAKVLVDMALESGLSIDMDDAMSDLLESLFAVFFPISNNRLMWS